MSSIDLLSVLVGEWSGSGRGEFPTIEPFEYLETLRFTRDEARPLLHYEQRTRRRNPGQAEYVPSHWESGFIRLLPDGQVELVNAQGSGRLEVLAGSLEQTSTGVILRLRSTAFLNDARMQETERQITAEGDTLHYTLGMWTTAVPQLSHHVEATLKRTP